MDKLIDIFGVETKGNNIVHSPIVDPIDTRNEWRLFKRMVKNNYLEEKNTTFWQIILKETSFKNQYPNIRALGFIAHILPMSTVICERGFSTMNLIKDELRNKLGNLKHFF